MCLLITFDAIDIAYQNISYLNINTFHGNKLRNIYIFIFSCIFEEVSIAPIKKYSCVGLFILF